MLVVLGIILVVAGAILAFAVDTAIDSVDLVAVGWILIVGGGIALLAAAVRGAGWMSMGNKKYATERHVSPDGQHYIEETRTN